MASPTTLDHLPTCPRGYLPDSLASASGQQQIRCLHRTRACPWAQHRNGLPEPKRQLALGRLNLCHPSPSPNSSKWTIYTRPINKTTAKKTLWIKTVRSVSFFSDDADNAKPAAFERANACSRGRNRHSHHSCNICLLNRLNLCRRLDRTAPEKYYLHATYKRTTKKAL